MSHIHFPDGVIPLPWWAGGYLITFAIIFLILKKMDTDSVRRRIPFVGVVSAVMLITMSVPLGFIPFHLSLAVLCGILAGPGLGFLAIFTVNLILALIGHGGITMVGLNTLVIGSEAAVGYYLFHLFSRRVPVVPGAAAAAFFALLVSTSLMVGIVGTSVGLAEALPHGEESHGHVINSSEDQPASSQEELGERLGDVSFLALTGWGAVAVILVFGILLESVVTALIVRFFKKVRPDLMGVSSQA